MSNKFEAVDGMKIGRGNESILKNKLPSSLLSATKGK
jgi:hypothetical protein